MIGFWSGESVLLVPRSMVSMSTDIDENHQTSNRQNEAKGFVDTNSPRSPPSPTHPLAIRDVETGICLSMRFHPCKDGAGQKGRAGRLHQKCRLMNTLSVTDKPWRNRSGAEAIQDMNVIKYECQFAPQVLY